MIYDSGALLFEAEGRLKRGTKYVHISYLFDVEEVYNRIVIDLSLSLPIARPDTRRRCARR